MPSGVVKKWFFEKGFGFITPDDGKDDVFVHRHALNGVESLEQGDAVTYEVEYDDRKGKWKASTCSTEGGDGSGGYKGGGGEGGGYGRSDDRWDGGKGKGKGGKGYGDRDRYSPY